MSQGIFFALPSEEKIVALFSPERLSFRTCADTCIRALQKTAMGTDSLLSLTDEELVRLALSGNPGAYNALVTRYRRAVVLVAQQLLPHREAAEDVAQEALLVALQSLRKLRDPQRFGSWLYAITRYQARRAVRQEKPAGVLDTELPAPVEATPESDLLRGETRRELTEALAALSPEHRVTFLLRYEEAWPVARIADFLALPLSTIKWRLHQARKQLKRQLLEDRKDTTHE